MYTLTGVKVQDVVLQKLFFLIQRGYSLEYPNCIKTLHPYAGLFETPIDTLQWGNYLICFKIYCYCAPYTRLKQNTSERPQRVRSLICTASISQHITKFWTEPLILKIIKSYLCIDMHIKTFCQMNLLCVALKILLQHRKEYESETFYGSQGYSLSKGEREFV